MHDSLVPALGDDVDAADVVSQVLERCLRERVVIGRVRIRRLLDLLVLERDRRGALEVGLVHDPNSEGRRPDERVDLVHLPELVPVR